MIFDRMRNCTAAPGSSCRRQNALSVKTDKNKTDYLRRKRMEIRKMRAVAKETFGQSDHSSGSDESLQTKRRENIGMEDERIEGEMSCDSKNDAAAPERCTDCSTHGMISVIGRRMEMEDAVAVELSFLRRGNKNYDFYGVYDGHGGYRVAEVCSEMLHKLLVNILGEENCEEINWGKVMTEGFKKIDDEVNKYGKEMATMGSTAVVAVVGDEEVVVANCGDSRALLYRGGSAVQLSDDHKPDRPDERERIEDSGGKVIDWNGQRVLGVLATSRSIGDQYLKPYVIPEPEVKVMKRTNMDEFLILASDGLWDVLTNDVACEVTRRCLDGQIRISSDQFGMRDEENIGEGSFKSNTRASEAAAILVELAIARGSSDNVSVVVVELKRPVFGQIGNSSSTYRTQL